MKTGENKTERRNMGVAEKAPFDRRALCLDETAWDEFIEVLDRPARPIPRLARLLSSVSAFDD